MEQSKLVHLPVSGRVDLVLAEYVAAIDLVAGGGARRVVLCGFPGLERTAAEVLGYAQASHVRFRLERAANGARVALIGPIEA